jgi:hypothetical protein
MRALAVALVLCVGLAVPLAAGAASPQAFSTPSRNIGCVYFAPELRCDIRNGLSPKAPRPRGCPSFTDWGQGLTLGARSAGIVCAGDTALGAPNVLAYGRTWHRGSITCTSRATGLTCRNARGHGFFLSRESWRRF